MDMLVLPGGGGGTHSHIIMEGENRDLNVFRFSFKKMVIYHFSGLLQKE